MTDTYDDGNYAISNGIKIKLPDNKCYDKQQGPRIYINVAMTPASCVTTYTNEEVKMNMIEKVARAICIECRIDESKWLQHSGLAEAAIKAMMEPSEAMAEEEQDED